MKLFYYKDMYEFSEGIGKPVTLLLLYDEDNLLNVIPETWKKYEGKPFEIHKDQKSATRSIHHQLIRVIFKARIKVAR